MPSSTQKSSHSSLPTSLRSRSRSGSNIDTARGNRAKSAPMDAIALLKADHKQVAEWFEQFESARSDEIKQALAQQICAALTVHATIEEEIFYPAFLDATGETDLHHEAEVEHQGAKNLIAEIEESIPRTSTSTRKLRCSPRLIRHHVNEEEQRDGMFAKAKESDMDLEALGEATAGTQGRADGRDTTTTACRLRTIYIMSKEIKLRRSTYCFRSGAGGRYRLASAAACSGQSHLG